MRTDPRRLTPEQQRPAASLDPAIARRLIELRHRIARLAVLPDVSQPMLGAIAAEVRRIRDQMDDAPDGRAGRWACESDLTPDNRQTIPCEDNNPGGCIHAGAVARRRSG